MIALPAGAANRPVELRELNFRLDALPDAWATASVPPGVPGTYYAVRPTIGGELLIRAIPVGLERQHKPDRIAADYLADNGLVKRETVRRSPATAGGLVGLKLVGETTFNGKPASFCGWFASSGGIEYRITCIDPRPGAFAEGAMDTILPRFALLDPKSQRRVADLSIPDPYKSPAYKYRVTLPRGWAPEPTLRARYPLPEYIAQRGPTMMFGVVPAIVGEDADPETVARSVCTALNWDWDTLTAREKFTAGRFTGFKLRRPFPSATPATGICRAKIWVGEGLAITAICVGWDDNAEAAADEAFAEVDVSGIRGADDPALAGLLMGDAELFAVSRNVRAPGNPRGLIQHDLGLRAAAAGDFARAASMFRLALQYELDPLFATDWISALVRANRVDNAFRAMEFAQQRFPADPRFLGVAARLASFSPDRRTFLDACAKAFPDHSDDDELFATYLSGLIDDGNLERADATLRGFKRRIDTPNVARAEAELMLAHNDAAGAVALLTARMKRDGTPAALATSLASAMIAAGDHAGAAAAIDAAEKAGGRLATPTVVMMLRGRLAMATGKFDEARGTFEKLKSIVPNEPLIDDWINAARSAAGQGKNGTLRDAIESAALPDDLAEISPAAKAMPLDRSSGAAYRRVTLSIRAEPGAPQRSTVDEIIEIYDQRGVEMFNTYTRTINPLDEKLFVELAEVRDGSGKVLWTGKPDDQYALDVGGTEEATLKQTVNVPIGGLRPGCTLRVRITTATRSPTEQVRFKEVVASRTLPTAEAVVFIAGDPARLKTVELNGAKRLDRPGKDGIAWRFLPPMHITNEPMLPDPSTFAPAIAFGDARQTWRDEGTDYLKLIADRLNADEAVRAEAKQMLATAGPAPMDRMRAIVAGVQAQYAYKAIAFGPRAYIPSEPAKIIANRYGDCKDQSLLVHLLLREAGIPSQLALVRIAGPVYPEIADGDQFDHVIVRVPECDGRTWWIDTTNRHSAGFEPTPSPGLLGRHALVLDPAGPTLVALDAWDPASSGLAIDRSAKIDAAGTLDVTERAVAHGALGSHFRSVLKDAEESRRAEYALRMLGHDPASLREWSAVIDGLESNTDPVTIAAHYVPRQKLRRAGVRLVGEVPAGGERSFLLPDTIAVRRMPFQRAWGLNYEVRLDLRWPAAWQSETLGEPSPGDLSSAFDSAEVTTASVAPGHWTARLVVHSKPTLFPAEQYEPFCTARQSIVDAFALPLVFRTDAAADR